MATLSDVLPAMVTALTGATVDGTTVVTVLDHIPEGALTTDEMPAVMLEVLPPTVISGRMNVRSLEWPIDVVILNKLRTGDVGGDVTDLYGLADTVIARLDAAQTLRGLLHKHIAYASPSVSADDDTAYGYTTMGDSTFIGTRVHTIVQIDRVGGF